MSNITVTIKKSELAIEDIPNDKIYRKVILKFVVGMKSLFAEYITQNYDISYKLAMNILRIKENESTFAISIESPETYNGKTQKTVATIMKNDLGSVTEKIRPLYTLKVASDLLSQSAPMMWIDYVAVRDRGEELYE